MEAATEDRVEETTDNEELTKAREEANAKLLLQIEAEHTLCDDVTWRNKQLKRLKLYNNQARDESKVGDPLLFTVFQTVFAALYDDRLTVEWEGNDEGDTDTAENLTDLSEHDYRIMQKDEADYEWIWDACFFGRGLLLLNEFDRTPGIMAPVAQPDRSFRDRRRAVLLGVDGVSEFDGLHSRQHDDQMQLYAFDILALDGDDIRKLPLQLRKNNLARLLARRIDGIFLSRFEQGEIGPDLFRHACKFGLEGLVSKHRDRPIAPGGRHIGSKSKIRSIRRCCGSRKLCHERLDFCRYVAASWRGRAPKGFRQ